MEPQLWSAVSCALASASWQSDMPGICLSLIFPHKSAREQTLRTKRNRTEIVVRRHGAVARKPVTNHHPRSMLLQPALLASQCLTVATRVARAHTGRPREADHVTTLIYTTVKLAR